MNQLPLNLFRESRRLAFSYWLFVCLLVVYFTTSAFAAPQECSDDLGKYFFVRRIGKGYDATVTLVKRSDGSFAILKEVRADQPFPHLAEGRLRADANILQRLEKADDDAVRAAQTEEGGHGGFQNLQRRRYFPDGVEFEFIEPKPGEPGRALLRMNVFTAGPGRMPTAPDFEVVPSLYDRLHSIDSSGKPNDPVLRDENNRIFILYELCEAYKRAHAAGIDHRDAKPGNTLVDSAGNLKITDMGIASVEGEPPYGYQRNRVSGTANYLSPDQMLGKRLSDDLYSLRKMIWEIVAYPHGLDPIAPEGSGLNRPGTGRFQRYFYTDAKGRDVYALELKYAPEFEGVNPRLALAVWGKWTKSVAELQEGIRRALDKNISDADFYHDIFTKVSGQDSSPRNPNLARASEDRVRTLSEDLFVSWYKNELKRLSIEMVSAPLPFTQALEAVTSILGSKAAIARFPEGLTQEKRDAVIRTAYLQYAATENQREPGGEKITKITDMPFLHWDVFFARVKKLGLDPELYKKQNELNDKIRKLRSDAEAELLK
jgi:Protein kinase domain